MPCSSPRACYLPKYTVCRVRRHNGSRGHRHASSVHMGLRSGNGYIRVNGAEFQPDGGVNGSIGVRPTKQDWHPGPRSHRVGCITSIRPGCVRSSCSESPVIGIITVRRCQATLSQSVGRSCTSCQALTELGKLEIRLDAMVRLPSLGQLTYQPIRVLCLYPKCRFGAGNSFVSDIVTGIQ